MQEFEVFIPRKNDKKHLFCSQASERAGILNPRIWLANHTHVTGPAFHDTLGKHVVAVNLEAIRFEFWMKGALVMEEICVVCGWRFSYEFKIVSETPFNSDKAGLEL